MVDIAPHPEPPGDLSKRRLPLVHRGGEWLRIHNIKHGPIYFGRSGANRFDAPGDKYGVLYVGATCEAAFIETFGHATGVNFVQQTELDVRAISVIGITRDLALVDLTGQGLARIGADERLSSGSQITGRLWSVALYEHPSKPDGLLYRARHDPSQLCAALFDRTQSNLVLKSTAPLGEPAFVDQLLGLLHRYDFGLV